MNKILLSLLLVLALYSCNKDNSYVIEGALYGGGKFEGETIYLVPFEKSSSSKIDSAIIHEGRFRFEGIAEKDEICVLRMRPMMRLFIQELIIVKEPGHVRTILSKRSSVQGTPQNDSLQSWNNYKSVVDSALFVINKQLKKATGDEYDILSMKNDSLKMLFEKHNRRVAERNNNVFGDFINKYAK